MTEPESNGAYMAAALVAAQADMPAVEADQTNPFFTSKYVSLGHLIAKVRPVLNAHGLMVAQFPSSQDGKPTLVTLLIHESGERIEYEAPLVLEKQNSQGFGSAMTYARRYALASALGISDQEDDDGNAGSAPGKATVTPQEPPKPPTDAATATGLFNVAKAAGVGGEALSLYLSSVGITHEPITNKGSAVAALQRLPEDKVDAVYQYLEGEQEKAKAPQETAA